MKFYALIKVIICIAITRNAKLETICKRAASKL